MQPIYRFTRLLATEHLHGQGTFSSCSSSLLETQRAWCTVHRDVIKATTRCTAFRCKLCAKLAGGKM